MTIDYRPRTYSICLNIDGFINASKYPDDYVGMFSNEGGDLSPEQAAQFLAVEKARGRKVIPFSAECGNPCGHANNGCSGFDYGGQGCPGRYADAVDAKSADDEAGGAHRVPSAAFEESLICPATIHNKV